MTTNETQMNMRSFTKQVDTLSIINTWWHLSCKVNEKTYCLLTSWHTIINLVTYLSCTTLAWAQYSYSNGPLQLRIRKPLPKIFRYWFMISHGFTPWSVGVETRNQWCIHYQQPGASWRNRPLPVLHSLLVRLPGPSRKGNKKCNSFQ